MFYKKYLKALLSIIIIVLVGIFLIALLHYFNIIKSFTVNVLKLIIIFGAMFYGGFVVGKNSIKKGYICGMKIGAIIDFILIIYNFVIMSNSINYKSIVFYLILLFIASIGGMIGISKSVLKEE